LEKQADGVTLRTSTRVAGGILAALLMRNGAAVAFPFVDPTNQDTLPGAGTEMPATDVTGLRNQLRLVNPAAPGNHSAWTIIPTLTIQEMLTDNAYEVRAPSRGSPTC